MPIARINNRLIMFAHIPKTGGTSVEAYMEQKGQVALWQARRSAWARTTAQHMQADVFTRFFPDGFYDAGFTIVRDPRTRLISEYKMRRSLAEERPPSRRLRGLAKSLLAGGEGVPGFDDWVRQTFARYRRDPYLYDNHIRPQVEFVHSGHRIFRFEDGLAPVMAWIDAVTETTAVDLAVHRRRSDPAAVDCAPSTEAMIRDFYRDDYALIEGL